MQHAFSGSRAFPPGEASKHAEVESEKSVESERIGEKEGSKKKKEEKTTLFCFTHFLSLLLLFLKPLSRPPSSGAPRCSSRP
jgi:hypothetical protein